MPIYEGRWVGSAPEDPLEYYLELDIAKQDDQYTIELWDHKMDRKGPKPVELTGSNSFKTSVAHWILKSEIELYGTFESSEILQVTVKKDGRTALESYTVKLKKTTKEAAETFDYSIPYHYQLPAEDKSFSFPPTVPTRTSAERLEQLVNTLKSNLNGRYDQPEIGRLEGLLVLQDDHLVLEEYFGNFSRDLKHPTASCVKSILAILYGVLYDQKLSSLDDVFQDAFPGVCTWEKPVTVENVLNMSSGSQFGPSEGFEMMMTDDLAKVVLGAPQIAEPGSVFNYGNGLPSLLAKYIELKSGLGIRKFAEKYLFGPLAITNYRLTNLRDKSVDGTPLPMMAGGCYMTLKDMAKIGALVLNDGVYEGKRIVSSEYISLMTQNHSAPDQYPYGLYWHVEPLKGRPVGPCAIGQGGQYIAVFPERKTVVVLVSSKYLSSDLQTLKTIVDIVVEE